MNGIMSLLYLNFSNNSNHSSNTSTGLLLFLRHDADIVLQIVTWLALIVFVGAVLINGLCLIAFFKDRKLRTVFNFYLINLTIADMGFAFSIPFFIVEFNFEITPFSDDICSLFMVIIWTFSSGAVHTVMLIGFDRVWAVYWPHHYRIHKNVKMSCCFIGLMWIWILLWLTPGFIADRIQAPSNGVHCDIEPDTPFKLIWGQMINLVSYFLPILLLIGAYALIFCKLRRAANRVTGKTEASHKDVDPERTSAPGVSHSRSKKEKRMLTVFRYLTLSVVVFWLPGYIYFPVLSFLPDSWNVDAQTAMQLSLFASTIVNPLVYQTGSDEMRTALSNLVCFRKRS